MRQQKSSRYLARLRDEFAWYAPVVLASKGRGTVIHFAHEMVVRRGIDTTERRQFESEHKPVQ